MQAEIWHYGIKGQKHGFRRFQNEDGTLTPEGKERYGIGDGRVRLSLIKTSKEAREKNITEAPSVKEQRKAKIKKVLAIVGGVALAGIAAYGIYKGTGKLQAQLRAQAKQRASDLIHDSERLRIAKNGEIRKMSAAKDLMKDSRRMNNDYMYSRANRWHQDAFKSAKSISDTKAQVSRAADYYSKMSTSATRMDAVKNYLKNKRKIVLPNI